MIDKRLNLGEEAELVLTKESSSFKEVLASIETSNNICIATYNLSKDDEGLINLLKGLPANVKVRLVTNIPNRWSSYYYDNNKEAARKSIKGYFTKLAVSKFKCDIAIYFNFNNHAKIILTDKHGYIGSANFSTESKNNFEAGVLIRSAEKIKEIEANFFNEIVENSKRYFGGSTEILGMELQQYAVDLQDINDKIHVDNKHLLSLYEEEPEGHVVIVYNKLQELEAILWTVEDCLREIQRNLKLVEQTGPILSVVDELRSLIKTGTNLRNWSTFDEGNEISEYFQSDPYNTGENTDESMDRAMHEIAWEKELLVENSREDFFQLIRTMDDIVPDLQELSEQIILLAEQEKKINNTGLEL